MVMNIYTVKQGTEYHFFVVGVEGDKVNLILDRNINSDGTLATVRIAPSETGIYNMVDWKSSNTDVGPTVANSFVKEATYTWINIDNINEQYADENKPYSLSSSANGPSYGVIVLTGRARLPKYSEVAGDNKCQPKTISGDGNCPLWLINYSQWVSTSASKPTGMTTEGFTSIIGYWLLASTNDYTNVAWYVSCGNGMLTYTNAVNTGTQKRGIRPVIEVYKDNLQH